MLRTFTCKRRLHPRQDTFNYFVTHHKQTRMQRSIRPTLALARTSIPKAIRENTWIRYNGRKFECKCHVLWCQNVITPFNFEVGHNIPVSRGGATNIDNLRPICSGCNKSMGNRYTIDEFSQLSPSTPTDRICHKSPSASVDNSCHGGHDDSSWIFSYICCMKSMNK